MSKFKDVFVIDDDKVFHFIIKKLFSKNNIDINPTFYLNGLEAIEKIKPHRIRPACHLCADGHFLFAARLSIHPIHPEVPLADARRRVALRLEQRGHGGAAWRNDRL